MQSTCPKKNKTLIASSLYCTCSLLNSLLMQSSLGRPLIEAPFPARVKPGIWVVALSEAGHSDKDVITLLVRLAERGGEGAL